MEQATGENRSASPPPRLEIAIVWPVGVQIAVVLLVTAMTFFLLGRWSHGWQPRNDVAEIAGPALNLNRATKAELRLVPGLGDALSQRIIDHRERNGPFHAVEDLRLITGIGPKTLERIRPHVFVVVEEIPVELDDGAMLPTESMSRTVSRSTGPSKKELALTTAINVNRADQAELQKLPGIGPKLSQRILDERAKAAFKSTEDLRRVSGIGPKTLEKLRPYVTID